MRTDEWRLAAGGTVYAPEHPLHLHVPGFWDELRIGGRAHSKLLCVSFVLERDGELIELFPYLSYWYWHPDRIAARYYLVVREGLGYKQQAGVRVFLDEVRRILPDGVLQCEFSFDLLREHPRELQVVAWGLNAELSAPGGEPPVSSGYAPALEVVVPELRHTPFLAMLSGGELNGEQPENGGLNALHWKVALDADAPRTVQVRCVPRVS